VKIDDTNPAHPQIGIEDADVVYIEQVEGGLTRLAVIFSSVIPQRIGPVRSARISDIDILSQFGRVAFAYSGAQKKLLPVIASANLQDLGAQRQSPTIYTTDPNRNQPFAMVLRADLLMQKIKDSDLLVDSAKSVGFVFGELQEGGAPTQKVEVTWPAATYSAEWSEKESRALSSMRSTNPTSSSSLKGFWMKSIAPFFIVLTAIGTSPCPVMKTMGRGERRSTSLSCSSRPVMPPMRMSTIKQATSRGSYRLKNDSAESKQRTR
jgi:hypothetical protein